MICNRVLMWMCLSTNVQTTFQKHTFRSLNNELLSVKHIFKLSFNTQLHILKMEIFKRIIYHTENWHKSHSFRVWHLAKFSSGQRWKRGNILTNHLSFPFKSHNFNLIASYSWNMATVQKFSIWLFKQNPRFHFIHHIKLLMNMPTTPFGIMVNI